MQRIKLPSNALLRPRASGLTVTANNAAACSNLQISWDASQGSGPWTVLVAPINQLPAVFDVASASGSSFSYNYPVPNFSSAVQAIVAVIDSTGNYAGTSQFVTFSPSSGASCSSPSTALDFVWYPTNSKTPPQECENWGITYQVDSANYGVQGDVSYTFLPEKGTPFTVDAGTAQGKSASINWQMAIEAGTQFAVVANDQGQTGTGGVGDLYQVATGSSSSCSAANAAVKLPPASQTVTASTSASSTSTSSSSSSTSTSSRTSATRSASSTAAPQPTVGASQNASTNGSQSSGSKVGAGVGATLGVLAGLGLIAAIIFCIRRKRRRDLDEKSRDPYGVNPNPQTITPWRWSGANEGAQHNSRTQRWFQRGSQGGTEAFDSVGFRANNENPFSSTQDSYASGLNMGGNGNDAPLRSAPHNRDDFVLSTIASSGMIENDARSSMPSHASYQASYNNHQYPTTVPDASLFPPPPSTMPTRSADGYHQYSNASPFDDPSTAMHTGVGTFGGMVPGDFYDGGASRYPTGIEPPQQPRHELVQSPQNIMSASSSASSQMGGKISRKRLSPADAAFAHTDADQNPTEFLAPIDMGRTSVFDPYNHQMRDTTTDNVQQDAGNVSAYKSPRQAPQPPQVTSEVLMMEAPEYRGRVSNQRAMGGQHGRDEDDDNAGLPYL